jgi:hypothetical protein
MVMNEELERMYKEAVTVYFNILSWYLPGGTEECHEIICWPFSQ